MTGAADKVLSTGYGRRMTTGHSPRLPVAERLTLGGREATKTFVLIAAAALSACSQEREDRAAAAAMEGAEPAGAVAMKQDAVGTYDVKRYNGFTSTIVIGADRTYTDKGPDGTTESGTFALKNGNYCFDPEGDEAEVCWMVSQPGAGGSFTATDPDGHTVTLTPRAPSEAGSATS